VFGVCSRNVSLFHGDGDEEEVFDMAQMTMGCGRRADSLKMALGWIYYGKEGYGGNLNPHLSFLTLPHSPHTIAIISYTNQAYTNTLSTCRKNKPCFRNSILLRHQAVPKYKLLPPLLKPATMSPSVCPPISASNYPTSGYRSFKAGSDRLANPIPLCKMLFLHPRGSALGQY